MSMPQERALPEPPRVEQGGSMTLVGLSMVCTENIARDIPALWQRFGALIGEIPDRLGSTTYGVCRQDHAGRVEYLCAVEASGTDDVPPHFSRWELAPQRYAVFSHAQHVSTIRETIHHIFGKRLAQAGLTHAAAPFFERYGPEFNLATGTGGVEIWVPVSAGFRPWSE
jgi:AraC family transcriptional regulator